MRKNDLTEDYVKGFVDGYLKALMDYIEITNLDKKYTATVTAETNEEWDEVLNDGRLTYDNCPDRGDVCHTCGRQKECAEEANR